MHKFIRLVLTASAIAVAAPACAQIATTDSSVAALQMQVDRQQDYIEIQNLMSLRSYYHAVGDKRAEFDLWAKRVDIVWGTASGYRIGYEHILEQYVNGERQQAERLAAMSRAHPEIANSPENLAVGTLVLHLLQTPIIEVAEDGRTAKGMWHTFGPIVNSTPDGGFDLTYTMEKYGVDFVKEADGQWRIWHAIVVADFTVPSGEPLALPRPPVRGEGQLGAVEGQLLPRDIRLDLYSKIGPTVTPRLFPQPPQPYRTFHDTFSYGPPLETVRAFLEANPQQVVEWE